MRYRRLSKEAVVGSAFVKAGDMMFGRSTADFWVDVPEAPAQAVLTRLRLNTGDWFLDLNEGTPWKTRVLGKHTASSRDPVVRFRTLNTIGVTDIDEYFSNLNRDTREFRVDMLISTVYGQVVVQGPL